MQDTTEVPADEVTPKAAIRIEIDIDAPMVPVGEIAVAKLQSTLKKKRRTGGLTGR